MEVEADIPTLSLAGVAPLSVWKHLVSGWCSPTNRMEVEANIPTLSLAGLAPLSVWKLRLIFLPCL